MTTLMSLPQNWCAEAALTSSKSKNSAITATNYTNSTHKRRWLSRLLLLGIVFSVFTSNLNAQLDFKLPLPIAKVWSNNPDSTDWLINYNDNIIRDAMNVAAQLICATDTCDSTFLNGSMAMFIRYNLNFDGNYYLYFAVDCPCLGMMIDSAMLANINDTLYLCDADTNKLWVTEILMYMETYTNYEEYYPATQDDDGVDGYWYVDGKWRRGTLHGIHICGNWYYGNLFYKDDNGKIQKSQWFHKRYSPPKIVNGLASQEFKFNLSPGDNLQVMTSMDAQCDVYDLETGKLLLQNVNIIGNNSYQAISIKPSNTPYVIIFKVNNEPVSLQHFIFNSSTNLSIGNQNE